MKFCVGIVIVMLVSAVAIEAQDLGICQLCVQRNKVSTCCAGDGQCVSEYGTMNCNEIEPSHEDNNLALGKFSSTLAERGEEDFCSISCGYSKEGSRTCSGKICSCTKHLYPTCYE